MSRCAQQSETALPEKKTRAPLSSGDASTTAASPAGLCRGHRYPRRPHASHAGCSAPRGTALRRASSSTTPDPSDLPSSAGAQPPPPRARARRRAAGAGGARARVAPPPEDDLRGVVQQGRAGRGRGWHRPQRMICEGWRPLTSRRYRLRAVRRVRAARGRRGWESGFGV
jgi:hypothetical protein